MTDSGVLLIIVVVCALLFDYINGFHDTANAIATSVSTRALSPRRAVVIAAVLNFVGALYSTGVAQTIAKDIVPPALVSQEMIIAALIGAIFWNLITWYFGIPSSSSHAIIGGLVGATISRVGFQAVEWAGFSKILAALLLSPMLGLLLGYCMMKLLVALFGRFSPSQINNSFRRLQVLSAALLAFNHGSNDAQKSMGIITMALVAAGLQNPLSLEPHLWVKFICALAMACGTAFGGWKIIRTMGGKIFKLEPINGFAADLSSSLIIWVATAFPGLHAPVSTTHVVSGSIIGVGMAKRISAVRWGIAQQMVFTWVVTIPSTAIVSGLIYRLISYVL
ncbi:MAG: inorganic phosphate transporter [Peptococcaceae bacterium]|jgi:PiT family inorganic phosphate transporter|nr:inorganic phosphate transporter [Peptococcaceae bacterium]